jgi:hypothetical protein
MADTISKKSTKEKLWKYILELESQVVALESELAHHNIITRMNRLEDLLYTLLDSMGLVEEFPQGTQEEAEEEEMIFNFILDDSQDTKTDGGIIQFPPNPHAKHDKPEKAE